MPFHELKLYLPLEPQIKTLKEDLEDHEWYLADARKEIAKLRKKEASGDRDAWLNKHLPRIRALEHLQKSDYPDTIKKIEHSLARAKTLLAEQKLKLQKEKAAKSTDPASTTSKLKRPAEQGLEREGPAKIQRRGHNSIAPLAKKADSAAATGKTAIKRKPDDLDDKDLPSKRRNTSQQAASLTSAPQEALRRAAKRKASVFRDDDQPVKRASRAPDPASRFILTPNHLTANAAEKWHREQSRDTEAKKPSPAVTAPPSKRKIADKRIDSKAVAPPKPKLVDPEVKKQVIPPMCPAPTIAAPLKSYRKPKPPAKQANKAEEKKTEKTGGQSEEDGSMEPVKQKQSAEPVKVGKGRLTGRARLEAMGPNAKGVARPLEKKQTRQAAKDNADPDSSATPEMQKQSQSASDSKREESQNVEGEARMVSGEKVSSSKSETSPDDSATSETQKQSPSASDSTRKGSQNSDADTSKVSEEKDAVLVNVSEEEQNRDPGAAGANIADDGLADSASRPERSARTELCGLTNHMQSCFSNAVLQLADAALEKEDLDALLGMASKIEDFGLSEEKAAKFDVHKHGGDLKGLKKLQAELRSSVQAAATAGETDKVSAAQHLRSLLKSMQAGYPEVTAYLFQTVLAFGGGSSAREVMSGDTQQDSLEYYLSLLDAIANDPMTADAAKLSDLFQIQLQELRQCRNKDCKHELEPRTINGSHYNVPVPASPTNKALILGDLFTGSLDIVNDETCPKCDKPGIAITTEFLKMPQNFVVQLGRTAYDVKEQNPFKVTEPVELDMHDFEMGLDETSMIFDLAAVICHRGENVQSGHYTAFRKLGDQWYHIDDSLVKKVVVEDVKDSPRMGQSAMLLYKERQS